MFCAGARLLHQCRAQRACPTYGRCGCTSRTSVDVSAEAKGPAVISVKAVISAPVAPLTVTLGFEIVVVPSPSTVKMLEEV